MNRLQKKCLIAAAGTHLLVVVVVLCSGFITSKPKVDDTQVLDMIPANVLENVLNSGVSGAQLPPPKPVVKLPEPTPPVPEPPKPPVTPPQPKPEPVKPPEDEKPPEKDPVVEIPKPKPPKPKHEIKVELTKVTRDPKKVVDDTAAEAAKAEKEAKRVRDQKLKAFQIAARSIKENSSTSTEINLSGNSSAAYANYGAVVVSVYHHAWTPPDNMASASAVVKFSVTIARDGSVISSRIVESSGDSSVDRAVQRMLDRVTDIAPFPEDSKDKQRTYPIDFNATRTNIL